MPTLIHASSRVVSKVPFLLEIVSTTAIPKNCMTFIWWTANKVYPRFRDKVVSPEVQCRHVSIFPTISYLSKCISRDLYAPKVFSKIESNPSWEKIDYHQWGAKMNQLGIQILSIALPAPSMVHQFRHSSCTHQIRVCFPVRGGDKISHRGWISGPTQPREKMSSYD